MAEKTKAPWTAEEVTFLNAYQRCGKYHEFTCGNDHDRDVMLVARQDGWHCPECDYRQKWAHKFMLEIGREEAMQHNLF